MLNKTSIVLTAAITFAVWACAAPTTPTGSSKSDVSNKDDDASPKKKKSTDGDTANTNTKTDEDATEPGPSSSSGAPATGDTGTEPTTPAGTNESAYDACVAKCDAANPKAAPIVAKLTEAMDACVCADTVCGKECGQSEWCVDGGTKVSDDDACAKCWDSQKTAQCQDAYESACNKDAECKRADPCYAACEDE